jgi:hypothetical protein
VKLLEKGANVFVRFQTLLKISCNYLFNSRIKNGIKNEWQMITSDFFFLKDISIHTKAELIHHYKAYITIFLAKISLS